jgi:hypothetical protein
MKKREMYHVGYRSPDDEPIPVTFYVSPEVWADPVGAPANRLADVLKPFLALAIEEHRKSEVAA